MKLRLEKTVFPCWLLGCAGLPEADAVAGGVRMPVALPEKEEVKFMCDFCIGASARVFVVPAT